MKRDKRRGLYGGEFLIGEDNMRELFNLYNTYQRFVVLVAKDQDYKSKHILCILCLEKDVFEAYGENITDVKKLSIDCRYNYDDYYVTISPIYKHMLNNNIGVFDVECLDYIERYLADKYSFFRDHELIELFIAPRDVDILVRFVSLKQHLNLDNKKFDTLMKKLYKNDRHSLSDYEYYQEITKLLLSK